MSFRGLATFEVVDEQIEVFDAGALEWILLAVGVLITLALAVGFVLIITRRDAAATEPRSGGEGS